MKDAKELFYEMNKGILEAGGLFYQYRPCLVNTDIIYDIENIKSGVVFAQTPLNMNDPFDSQIGFSVNEFYKDCINILINSLDYEPKYKEILIFLIENKYLGNFATIIELLKEIKSFLIGKRICCRQTSINLIQFVASNFKMLLGQTPKQVKNKTDKNTLSLMFIIAASLEKQTIDEKSINDFYKVNDLLTMLKKEIEKIKKEKYEPFLRDFISKMTVSCFSVSGWNNKLMWAHYAKSYSGICIEYDFTKIKDFKGFIYPVEYVNKRPSILLKDVGVKNFNINAQNINDKIVSTEIDTERLLKLLCVKDKVWEYENEWRIINIENTPNAFRLIDLPYIKSITFGINVNPLCKKLLLDICQEKEITCYNLIINQGDFDLNREIIDYNTENDNCDINEYIDYLSLNGERYFNQLQDMSKSFTESVNNKIFDIKKLNLILQTSINGLSNIYLLKMAIHDIYEDACKKGESTELPTELIESIKDINNTMLSFDDFSENIDFQIFTKKGYDYKQAKNNLDILKNIINKYEKFYWFNESKDNELFN